MNWEPIIGVIVTLVGLFFTIGKPIIKLNQSITTLNVTLANQEKRIDGHDKAFEKQQQKAKESHDKLWAHNEKQDEMLTDHEKRIFSLEHDNGNV